MLHWIWSLASICLFEDCGRNQTRCKFFNQCIFKLKVCDGKIDCLDGSDEEECRPTSSTKSSKKNNKYYQVITDCIIW